MASEKVLEVTCDVCGRTERYYSNNNLWRRSVWALTDGYYDSSCKSMEQFQIDICDECLEKATRLRYDRKKYTINYS